MHLSLRYNLPTLPALPNTILILSSPVLTPEKVAATTAVNSATLAGAASTTGTGTSSAASMAGSASAAATTGSTAASGSGSSKPSSSAASASASGAAHSQTGELAWGLILGGVGVVGAVVGAGLGF